MEEVEGEGFRVYIVTGGVVRVLCDDLDLTV